jgi:hypothetical protein
MRPIKSTGEHSSPSRKPSGGFHLTSFVDCIEIDPINREVLVAQGFNVIGEDFLSMELKAEYDIIVMNPPFNGREYIKHIQKAKSLLAERGKLAAIAPTGAYTDSTKAGIDFRNMVAEHGSWEGIGAPFEFTKTNCLMLKVHNLSASEKTRLWSKTNGYPSWFAYELLLYLDNEPESHELYAKEEKDRPNIGSRIDSIVDEVLASGVPLYYTKELREYAIDEFLKGFDDIELESSASPFVANQLRLEIAA